MGGGVLWWEGGLGCMAQRGHHSVSCSTGWSLGPSITGECPALQIALEEQVLGIRRKAHARG